MRHNAELKESRKSEIITRGPKGQRQEEKPLRLSNWKQIVDTAMVFPMGDVVKRYMRDTGVAKEVAQEHERELKRFLALVAMNPSKIIGMSGIVDELWHTFLMFTREYHSFSLLTQGSYIHHKPETSTEPTEKGKRHYQNFWDEYKAVFGAEPPAHIWPQLTCSTDQDGSLSCSGCSGCGCSCGCSCVAR